MDGEDSRLQRFARGEVIFAEGTEGELAYVLREGEVDILKGAGAQPVFLRRLQPGDMFGEMSLITSNPRAATAVARTEVSLEPVDRVDFARMLQADSEFAMLTMKRLAGMVPEAQAQLMSAFKAQDARAHGAGETPRRLFGLARRKRDEISAFEPDFVQIEQQPVPLGIRLSGLAISAFLVAALVWATIASIETTVSGTGRVVSTVPNVQLQPFDTGIVRKVAVRQGQLVRRGQVLATLDPTVSEADLQATRAQLVSTDAQIERLRTELGRADTARFSADPAEEALQRRLYEARIRQLRSSLTAQDQEARNLETQIEAKHTEVRDAERRLSVLREIAGVRETYYQKERDAFLRDGQYRLQHLDAQRTLVEAERDRSVLQNAIASLRAQLQARRAHREAFLNDWNAKSNQDLVVALRERSRLTEQFKKFDRANRLIEIVAPTDAIVLAVRTRTPGTIARASEAFIDLVPTDVPLEVEIDISSRDVAQLQVGDPVNIKLDSLPFVKHGAMEGTLRLISEDSFEKTLAGTPGPVFRARVAIGQSHLVLTPPNFRLLPGMTVVADVKVGKRKLITYFTYPILRSGRTSFREP